MATTVTIRLPDPLRKELVRISREEGVPVSILVRQSIGWLLFEKRFKKAQAASIPYARAAGYFTEEDILKIKS